MNAAHTFFQGELPVCLPCWDVELPGLLKVILGEIGDILSTCFSESFRYHSHPGDEMGSQASGAYIFRPKSNTPLPIAREARVYQVKVGERASGNNANSSSLAILEVTIVA